jgi:hypothetical protein
VADCSQSGVSGSSAGISTLDYLLQRVDQLAIDRFGVHSSFTVTLPNPESATRVGTVISHGAFKKVPAAVPLAQPRRLRHFMNEKFLDFSMVKCLTPKPTFSAGLTCSGLVEGVRLL